MTMASAESADPDLRAQFAALRERELAAAPEFEVMLAGTMVRATPSRRRAIPRPGWAAALGVAALAMAVWLVPAPRPTTSAPDSLALPGWRTPTDSLLADAADPLQRQSWSWTTLPTAALGPSFLPASPETRR